MELDIEVLKRDGSVEPFSEEKIARGLLRASKRTIDRLEDADIGHIIRSVKGYILDNNNGLEPIRVTTDSIYGVITNKLLGGFSEGILQEYLSFNKYKDTYAESFDRVREFSESVLFSGDKENANKDTALNSTKQSVISETTMKELMRTFELEPEWVKAHDEGWIHIHDMGAKFLNGINCCLFDMGNLLKGGFEINGVRYKEPGSIQTALNVIGDVTLSASGNQFGGFTIPEIDTILAYYAEKSYDKWYEYYSNELDDANIIDALANKRVIYEIRKGYVGFETKLNTISNSLGQVPFVTISFGMDTGYWARVVANQILVLREEGMGERKTTAVFPKLIFLSRNDINRDADSPNYDLYLQAIKTSKVRMYPDYLSFDGAEDGNNLAEIYEESGKIVSPMGCRAFLGRFYHPETGEMVITGRNNIGAVSLNIPKIAIESNKEDKRFFELLDKYAKMTWDIHDWSFERIAKSKGSSNPLLYCEGGSWLSVGYDEEIRPIIKASTASIGYVGLNEASEYLFGKSIKESQEFGLSVVKHLKDRWVDAETGKHEFIPALYSTPAESLVYRFQKLNRKKYGTIPKVTDREYMTNSFHVHVAEEVTPVEKIFSEAAYHKVATGGRISFAEYPYGLDDRALKHCVDYAMDLGLYNGVNIVSSSCPNCTHQGDFLDACPECGNTDITTVTRACGYLSFSKIKGDTRYNVGKQAEIKERVKHIKEG